MVFVLSAEDGAARNSFARSPTLSVAVAAAVSGAAVASGAAPVASSLVIVAEGTTTAGSEGVMSISDWLSTLMSLAISGVSTVIISSSAADAPSSSITSGSTPSVDGVSSPLPAFFFFATFLLPAFLRSERCDGEDDRADALGVEIAAFGSDGILVPRAVYQSRWPRPRPRTVPLPI